MPRGRSVPVSRRAATRVLRVAFGVLAAAACGYALNDRWADAGTAAARLSPPALAGALGAAFAALGAAMLAWRRLLAGLGSPLPLRPASRVYFTSQLGKYLPGSVWVLLAQIELARDLRVPRRRSAVAGSLAMAATIAGALTVAAVTLPLSSPGSARGYWMALTLAPVLLACLHPRVLNPVLNRVLRLARRPPLERELSAGTAGRVLAWVLLVWLLFGLHAWLLASGVRGDGAGPGAFPLATGAFALAFALGFLFILAPAGVGVREAVLVAGLAPMLDPAAALVVALVSRLLVTLADVAWAGLSLLATAGPWAARRPTFHPP